MTKDRLIYATTLAPAAGVAEPPEGRSYEWGIPEGLIQKSQWKVRSFAMSGMSPSPCAVILWCAFFGPEDESFFRARKDESCD